MSEDPRVPYMNARTAYEAALRRVREHVRLVAGVSEQLARSPAGFIDATVEKKRTGGTYTTWDLSKWPSADDLRRDALSLKTAFETCMVHWEALPEDGRGGCMPPPSKLGAE